MSGPRRRKAPARPAPRRRPPREGDFWGRDDAGDDDVEVITPPQDPTVMIRSLGPPPLPGGEMLAEQYFAMVCDKAANLAVALAASAGLLDTYGDDASSELA